MNNLFKIATTSSFFVLASLSGEASAKAKCIDEVCAAFINSEMISLRKELEELKGKRRVRQVTFTRKQTVVKPSQRQMKASVAGRSCAIFKQRLPSTIVFYTGSYENRGNVIAVVNPKWKKVVGGYQATACVSKKALANATTVAACGLVGHYDFNRAETNQFKRQSGPLGANDVARMWDNG